MNWRFPPGGCASKFHDAGVFVQIVQYGPGWMRLGCGCLAALLALTAVRPLAAREKTSTDYGAGLIVNIPVAEPEVARIVADVAQNGIIRGTREYSKDEYVKGAAAADSTSVFPTWTEGGRVYYKVRKQALDPENFRNSGDIGTLAVRYVVQAQGDRNTVLRIDAIFVEDFRRVAHASNGSVESSEYKTIQDRLDELELMKKQAAEAESERQQQLAKKKFGLGDSTSSPESLPPGAMPGDRQPRQDPAPAVTAKPGEILEQHVASLRHEVERVVKAPGAPLKSAPFRSAGNLKSLPAGTEVLILITTPYWFGVETREGQHGWIPREQLEELP